VAQSGKLVIPRESEPTASWGLRLILAANRTLSLSKLSSRAVTYGAKRL